MLFQSSEIDEIFGRSRPFSLNLMPFAFFADSIFTLSLRVAILCICRDLVVSRAWILLITDNADSIPIANADWFVLLCSWRFGIIHCRAGGYHIDSVYILSLGDGIAWTFCLFQYGIGLWSWIYHNIMQFALLPAYYDSFFFRIWWHIGCGPRRYHLLPISLVGLFYSKSWSFWH